MGGPHDRRHARRPDRDAREHRRRRDRLAERPPGDGPDPPDVPLRLPGPDHGSAPAADGRAARLPRAPAPRRPTSCASRAAISRASAPTTASATSCSTSRSTRSTSHVEFTTWAVVECARADRRAASNPDDVGSDRRFARALAADATRRRRCAPSPRRLLRLGRDRPRARRARAARASTTTSPTSGASRRSRRPRPRPGPAARGVCQDYAHCMVALCRLCGLPARYVSGHLLGDGGTHAWVEVLARRTRAARCAAVPFDPDARPPRRPALRHGRRRPRLRRRRRRRRARTRARTPGELTTHKRAAVVRVEYLQPQRRGAASTRLSRSAAQERRRARAGGARRSSGRPPCSIS